MTTPWNWTGTNFPSLLGSNSFNFPTNLNYSIDWGGMSRTTPTAGAPGNLNGVQQALEFFSNPAVQALPEKVQIAFAGNPNLLGSTQLDIKGMTEAYGKIQKEMQERMFEAEAARAERANEMGRDNLVLGSLLKLPGQISDSWARAATAGLPYQQEARQMMANTAANLQTGYNNLANMNTQFGNQVTNLFSNAASYKPTLIAGKYF